ncbi:hypothetical protein BJ508DRAFT_66137 [Ascobolus immersus RN42]|uniref:Uncharacterized protein n=1 Tax=Ascobolus immersus RN42 TaxID=1160509 RepID=A0A3N4IFK3_ASCIM|nr:hypothetical protein BJ508DRAFT_66137 [Ascobolus immersus RN42]
MDHQQHYYPLYFPEHFPREAHSQYASQRREMETQDLELRRFSLSPWEVYPQDSRDAYDLDPNNFELEYNNLINDFSESEDVQSEDFPDTMHCDRVQVQGQPEATSQPFDIDAPPSMTQGSLSSIESDATTLESFEDADTVMNEPQDEIPSKNADVVMVMDIQRQPELQYTAQHIRALVQKTVAHMQEEQELAGTFTINPIPYYP